MTLFTYEKENNNWQLKIIKPKTSGDDYDLSYDDYLIVLRRKKEINT